MNTVDKLNELARLQHEAEMLMAEIEAKKSLAIPDEVKQAIREIDLEFASLLEAAPEAITKLRAEIVAEVLAAGESVKGEKLQAVYSKGRVTWDTKSLDGYAAAHTELNEFRKQSDPTVIIRAVKGG